MINKFRKIHRSTVDTLDNLLALINIKYEEVKRIRIDVEGAELEVIKGANNVMSKSKDISILIEIQKLGNEQTLYQPLMDLLNN